MPRARSQSLSAQGITTMLTANPDSLTPEQWQNVSCNLEQLASEAQSAENDEQWSKLQAPWAHHVARSRLLQLCGTAIRVTACSGNAVDAAQRQKHEQEQPQGQNLNACSRAGVAALRIISALLWASNARLREDPSGGMGPSLALACVRSGTLHCLSQVLCRAHLDDPEARLAWHAAAACLVAALLQTAYHCTRNSYKAGGAISAQGRGAGASTGADGGSGQDGAGAPCMATEMAAVVRSSYILEHLARGFSELELQILRPEAATTSPKSRTGAASTACGPPSRGDPGKSLKKQLHTFQDDLLGALVLLQGLDDVRQEQRSDMLQECIGPSMQFFMAASFLSQLCCAEAAVAGVGGGGCILDSGSDSGGRSHECSTGGSSCSDSGCNGGGSLDDSNRGTGGGGSASDGSGGVGAYEYSCRTSSRGAGILYGISPGVLPAPVSGPFAGGLLEDGLLFGDRLYGVMQYWQENLQSDASGAEDSQQHPFRQIIGPGGKYALCMRMAAAAAACWQVAVKTPAQRRREDGRGQAAGHAAPLSAPHLALGTRRRQHASRHRLLAGHFGQEGRQPQLTDAATQPARFPRGDCPALGVQAVITAAAAFDRLVKKRSGAGLYGAILGSELSSDCSASPGCDDVGGCSPGSGVGSDESDGSGEVIATGVDGGGGGGATIGDDGHAPCNKGAPPFRGGSMGLRRVTGADNAADASSGTDTPAASGGKVGAVPDAFGTHPALGVRSEEWWRCALDALVMAVEEPFCELEGMVTAYSELLELVLCDPRNEARNERSTTTGEGASGTASSSTGARSCNCDGSYDGDKCCNGGSCDGGGPHDGDTDASSCGDTTASDLYGRSMSRSARVAANLRVALPLGLVPCLERVLRRGVPRLLGSAGAAGLMMQIGEWLQLKPILLQPGCDSKQVAALLTTIGKVLPLFASGKAYADYAADPLWAIKRQLSLAQLLCNSNPVMPMHEDYLEASAHAVAAPTCSLQSAAHTRQPTSCSRAANDRGGSGGLGSSSVHADDGPGSGAPVSTSTEATALALVASLAATRLLPAYAATVQVLYTQGLQGAWVSIVGRLAAQLLAWVPNLVEAHHACNDRGDAAAAADWRQHLLHQLDVFRIMDAALAAVFDDPAENSADRAFILQRTAYAAAALSVLFPREVAAAQAPQCARVVKALRGSSGGGSSGGGSSGGSSSSRASSGGAASSARRKGSRKGIGGRSSGGCNPSSSARLQEFIRKAIGPDGMCPQPQFLLSLERLWGQHGEKARSAQVAELREECAYLAPAARLLSPPHVANAWLPACANPRCANLEGGGEAELTTQPCAKCKAVWYCSRGCQEAHWRAGHKEVCAALCGKAPKGG